MTAHWISEDLKRHSAALACTRLAGSHTFDVVAESLIGINTKYGLDHRIITFTITDNRSNMVKAFAEYQEPDTVNKGMSESDDDDDDDYTVESADVDAILSCDNSIESSFLPKHMRCASHTLNLVATTDFVRLVADESYGCKRLVRSAFAKCSKLWNNVSRSTKSTDASFEIVRMSLRSPGETRWNATYVL